jgi:hypothetical protein
MPSKRNGGPVRVGFVSSFLRSHSVGRLMNGVISHLSKVRERTLAPTLTLTRTCVHLFVCFPVVLCLLSSLTHARTYVEWMVLDESPLYPSALSKSKEVDVSVFLCGHFFASSEAELKEVRQRDVA